MSVVSLRTMEPASSVCVCVCVCVSCMCACVQYQIDLHVIVLAHNRAHFKYKNAHMNTPHFRESLDCEQ